jgi:hypothetical protein
LGNGNLRAVDAAGENVLILKEFIEAERFLPVEL